MFAASCRRSKVCFCQSSSTNSIISPIVYHHGFSGRFPGAIEPCGRKSLCPYSNLLFFAIVNVSILSITVGFWSAWCLCHDLRKASSCSACYAGVWECYAFSLSSSPQNFFQIISNLLEEENKEKWEDAQKVSMWQYT